MNTNRGSRLRMIVLPVVVLALGGRAFAVQSKNSINLANPATQTTSTMAVTFQADSVAQATGFVTVNNGTQNPDNRAFSVSFRLTNPGMQGGLAFDLVNTANGNVMDLSGSPTSTSQVLSGSFASGAPANTNQVFTIAFRVRNSPIAAPGTYTATIVETVYGGSTLPSGPALDTNSLSVTITVGTLIDVSVTSTGGAFSVSSTTRSLDFGNLAAGQSLGADILVRTNVAYSLSLSSANSGSLANTTDTTSRIGYALTSNGSTVGLNPGPGRLASGAPATYQNASRYAISVTILPFAGLPAEGAYTDTITVTLSSP